MFGRIVKRNHLIEVCRAEIAASTKTALEAYRNAYCELFDRRKKSYKSAIGEIKNRAEWGPLEANNSSMAAALLSPLQGRVGSDEDKETVKGGSSLGKSSLTEMESDLAAIDGLKSSVLVKLQELSIVVMPKLLSERCGCPSSSIAPL